MPLKIYGVVNAVHDIACPVVAEKIPMVLGSVDRVDDKADMLDVRREISVRKGLRVAKIEKVRTGSET